MSESAHHPRASPSDHHACAPLAHGEAIAPHSHEYGQLRYAASGALVTTTPVGTWAAPANRIMWVPPRFEHSSRSYGATDVRLFAVPAALAARLPPEPSVCVASGLVREAFLALLQEPAESPRARLLLEVGGASVTELALRLGWAG